MESERKEERKDRENSIINYIVRSYHYLQVEFPKKIES